MNSLRWFLEVEIQKSRMPESKENIPIELGVIEFHTLKKPKLIIDFYMMINNCKGQIIDVYLMRIAAILKRHGYTMTITKDVL